MDVDGSVDDDYDLPPPASSVQKNSNQGKNPATPKSTPQQHQKKKSSPTSSATGPPRGLAILSAPPAPNPKEDPKPQSTQIAQAAVPTLPSGKKLQGGNTTAATSPAASSSKAAPKTGEQPIKQSTPQTGAPRNPPVESPTSSPAPPPQPPRQAGVTLPEKGSGKRKTPLPEREPGLPKTQPGSTSSSTPLGKEEVKKKHKTSDVTEPDPKRVRIDAGPETVAEHQRTFELGEKFWKAAEKGDEVAMKQILSENSSINVNWKNEKKNGMTPLHRACNKGHDKIVALLLAHPDIDVNVKTSGGETPFCLTCRTGRISCAQLLLKDARVQVNEPNNEGYTPLRWAARGGHLDIIKVWIASRMEMNLGEPGNEKTDAIGAAKNPEKKSSEDCEYFEERKDRCAEVATLLEKFKANPAQTRTEIRKELGIAGRCRLILRSTSFTIILDPTSLPFLRLDLFRLPRTYSTKADERAGPCLP